MWFLSGVLCFGCGSSDDTVILEEPLPSEETPAFESTGESEGTERYFVHVCGAVADPGVYELPAGSRVFDAVDAAGGFLEDASRDALNLAKEVEDEMKIQIPTIEEAKLALEAAGGIKIPEWLEESLPEEAGKVDINTAGVSELTSLNGIGQARAQDIIAYREANGPFQSIEDIKQVSGIKDAVFQKIKDEITVSQQPGNRGGYGDS